MSTQGVHRIEYLHLVSHPRREIDAKLWAIYQFLEAPEGSRQPDKLIKDAAFLFLLPGVEQSLFIVNDLLSICQSFLDHKGVWLKDEKPRLIRLAMNPPPFPATALMANLNYYPPIPITGEIDNERLIEKCKNVVSYEMMSPALGLHDRGDVIQARSAHKIGESVQDASPFTPLRVYNLTLQKFNEATKMRMPLDQNADRKSSGEATLFRATTAPDISDATHYPALASQIPDAEKKNDAVKTSETLTTRHSVAVNCIQCGRDDVVDLGTNAHGLHFSQCNNCKRCFRHEAVQKNLNHEKLEVEQVTVCPSCCKSDCRKSGTGGGAQRYFCKQCKQHFIPGQTKKRKVGTIKETKDEDHSEENKTQKKMTGLEEQTEADECREGGREALLEIERAKSIPEQVKELNSLVDEDYCKRCSGKLVQLDQVHKEVEVFTCKACHCRFKKSFASNDHNFMEGSNQFFSGQEKIITLLRDANQGINRSLMEKDHAEFLAKMKEMRDRLEEKRTSIMVKLNALRNGTDDVSTEVVPEGVKSGKTGKHSVMNPFQEAILLLRRETPILEHSVSRLMHLHTQFSFSSIKGTRERNNSEKDEDICKEINETFHYVLLTKPFDGNPTESDDKCFKLASRVVQDDGEEIEIYEKCDDS